MAYAKGKAKEQQTESVKIRGNLTTNDADIYAIYAERHRTSVRVKALIDFVEAAFKPRA